jgi:hypothetical protein
MDWTLGSNRMTLAENAYNAETGDNVHFGVGTDGCAQTDNMGGCYRITYGEGGAGSPAQPSDLIVQSVNSGHDVHCPQFDVQVGIGGQGLHNNCIGGAAAMFEGTQDDMGERFGGWRNRADCAKSPKHLKNATHMTGQGDDMVKLCELSFDLKIRGEDGLNSRIIKMSQVTCPAQLTAMTGFRRSDQDNFGYQHNEQGEFNEKTASIFNMIYSKKVKLHESKKLGSPTAKNEEQDFFHLLPLAPHTALFSTQSFRQRLHPNQKAAFDPEHPAAEDLNIINTTLK